LYYPDGATPPFAAIAVVPGFTAQRSDVAPWGTFLASHGIVALVLDTNTTSDQPDVRSRALVDALESVKKENMRDGSPVKGKIDTSRLGVMGWSMGGGGTWITADAHPELKVAVSLCGWIVQPAGSRTKVPSLQFAARDDSLAAGMSQPVYDAIPASTPKMLIQFDEPTGLLGGHYVANDPANMNQQIGAYGLSWIKVYLEGDDRYRQFFKMMPTESSDFKTNQK
jgi:dienelactone hydrolase